MREQHRTWCDRFKGLLLHDTSKRVLIVSAGTALQLDDCWVLVSGLTWALRSCKLEFGAVLDHNKRLLDIVFRSTLGRLLTVYGSLQMYMKVLSALHSLAELAVAQTL